ncbi:recombinase family protein [Actinoplanes sp. NPDC051470]|uniref:recombinase family protein n=1 Tax=Actinoplanes sp. NPDC051470 TaxID=3157224 RepID=UPI0034188AF6
MAATPSRAKRRRTRTGFGDTPTGTRRVALYLRRSTDDEHQPFSIDAQLAALTSYVNSQPGWILAAEPFTDDASGATTERPGLQRALRAAKAGRYDILLVYRVDRFSRRLSDLLDLLNELDDAGVAFASATEPFDTSTSIGRMLVQLLGVFAEFERETIIDRVINGMNAKAAKGRWAGGTRPYGYLIDPATQKLVPHENESPILREIVRFYTDQRLGTRAIAAELNRRGITNRTGKKWSGLTIGRILDNPAYTGDIVYGDTHVTDAHPALIDRETWRRVRDIADARSDTHHQRAMSDSDYHLTGLITCPRCKNRYIGTSAKGRTRRYHYYTCYSRTRYGADGCTSPRLDAPALDEAVLQALHDFYRNADTLIADAITRAQAHHRGSNTDRQAELDAVEAAITAKTSARDKYRTAFENGTMDEEDTGPRLRELRTEIEALKVRRAEITDLISDEPTAPSPSTLARIRDHLHHVIADGTSAERKATIEKLVAEVRITDNDEIIPVFRVPGDVPVDADDTATSTGDASEPDPVRAMLHLVGRQGLEP